MDRLETMLLLIIVSFIHGCGLQLSRAEVGRCAAWPGHRFHAVDTTL